MNEYRVTRRWTSGPMAGTTVTEVVNVPLLPGDIYEPSAMSDGYEVLTVEEVVAPLTFTRVRAGWYEAVGNHGWVIKKINDTWLIVWAKPGSHFGVMQAYAPTLTDAKAKVRVLDVAEVAA